MYPPGYTYSPSNWNAPPATSGAEPTKSRPVGDSSRCEYVPASPPAETMNSQIAAFVKLSDCDTPLSCAAGKSKTGAAGATESNVIASWFESALTFPARSVAQAVYVHVP